MKKIHIIILSIALINYINVNAQNEEKGQIHGNFQTDFQTYTEDSLIGASSVSEKMLMNSFANINYTKGSFKAGFRYEGYLNTLQGFDPGYDGIGIPYRYATYDNDGLEITVGNYYEQFGSGIILRSYEDKALGYDNAFDGVRLKYNPAKGIYITGLVGKQRKFYDYLGLVRGFDGDLYLNEAIPSFESIKPIITLGGSFVSKFQEDRDAIYILPENVAAFSGRMNIVMGKINLSGEYAYKINDPSFENNFIYKPGNALILNATYSKKGMGIFLTAKRIDNMSFRSLRGETLNNLLINYVPTIAKPHSYSLAAMYPYATQLNGEIGFQAEFLYKFKKESLLGGKYGTGLSLNYSRINNIDQIELNDSTPIGTDGTLGYKSNYFKIGDELYFQDMNVEINKKISKKLKTVITYQNLFFNYAVVRGMPGHDNVHANVFIADVTYKLKKKHVVRTELQTLFTEQDLGDWAMGLIEYTISPHWFFAVMDQYNYGNPEAKKQIHYFSVSGGYSYKSNRFQISYGRQREGIVCVGGVCRSVPASNGLTVSISSSF